MKRPPKPHSEPLTDEAAVAVMSRLARRSFTVGGLAALAGAAGLGWLVSRPADDGLVWPLRKMLEANEGLAQRLFDPRRLAPEFPADRAAEPRVNGLVGLKSPIVQPNWTVEVIGKVQRQIPLAAIKELPAHEMTTEFKCVEGWSRIVSWKGVRLADFLSKFGTPSEYVGLSTPPDGLDPQGRPDHYYVGFDRPSALHPQTLLCYEMNGRPLTAGHGAPLRLVSTVKYGYKCIKRIRVIDLTDSRPIDYWAKRGYDWYGGH